MINRTKEEYGGFLPLELNEREEYFQYSNTEMIRFNCAKASINYILEMIPMEKIYVPYYLCPNVCNELEKHDIDIIYYHINEDLLPMGIEDDCKSCLYLVDYFGIMDKKIIKFVETIKESTVIIDNCHSFFNSPIFKKNIFNIYSCKKFFGVPDGAYLIGLNLKQIEMKENYSAENSMFLLESLEHGTNYCYKKKKEVDFLISQQYGSMSVLARKIMKSIDYEVIKERRRNNLKIYQKAFNNINRIHIEKNSIPYIYPLNVGKNIKNELIQRKIYVPTLWAQMLERFDEDVFEYRLTDETIFLPVDQRYNEKDIVYIVEVVNALI